ncbi:MAG: Mut7-C RNAse domain-containing protein [Dehalococcoidales bacterium]|nr:Mut7-C RNAse domain-containing protein [Dehalococcoidales bacterium]
MGTITSPRFIVDHNVGKLARWLRMMGYDTRLFSGDNDSHMVALAREEKRVILTRDTQIMKRRVVTSGRVAAIFIESDEPERQIRQVITALDLDPQYRPFSLCLECNHPLEARSKAEVAELVPPYVFRTQSQYMACPRCHRIYWRGTHWRAMTEKLKSFTKEATED